MILWVLLFALVIAISFVLALKSMADFQEIPEHAGAEYGLFLIRKPQVLNTQMLTFIHQNLLKEGLIISFERLIKGTQAALVVYGPKKMLFNIKDVLDLLELEDYTSVNQDNFLAWEIGVRHPDVPQFPALSANDQLWWQLILSAKKDQHFHPHIRMVVVSDDSIKRESLKMAFSEMSPDKFVRLPKDFSDIQLLEFYKKRGFRKDSKNRNLRFEEVLNLLKVG